MSNLLCVCLSSGRRGCVGLYNIGTIFLLFCKVWVIKPCWFQHHSKVHNWSSITCTLVKNTQVRVPLQVHGSEPCGDGPWKLCYGPHPYCVWEALVSQYCSQIRLVTGFWNLNIQFWQELLCSQWISLSTLHFSLSLSGWVLKRGFVTNHLKSGDSLAK